MTYNPNVDSGYVDRKSWVQVPSAVFTGIDQSTEFDGTQGMIRSSRNYAQMVYQVNPSGGSGSAISGIVGLDDSGTVKLSGDQIKVFDGELLNKLNDVYTELSNVEAKRFSKIVKVNGNYTYVMDADIGTGLSGDAIWRVQRVYDDGLTIVVEWADGNDDFDNIAANYLSLAYTL